MAEGGVEDVQVLSNGEIYDFSELPEDIWAKVLAYLPLSDRAHVSETCVALNNVYEHPALWQTVEIILSSRQSEYTPTDIKIVDPEKHLVMIERFGRYIKRLVVVYIGYTVSMPKECRAVLDALALNCNLEHLVLDIDTVSKKNDFFYNTRKLIDLSAIVKLVVQSKRLRGFKLRSWPKSDNLLSALLSSDRPVDLLQQLDIFWEGASHATWATMLIDLPSQGEMLAIVQRFRNLQFLSVRSSMLSEEIILALADSKHVPLRNFSILVTYSSLKTWEHLPQISAEAWLKLREHSPNLGVEFTIMTRIPTFDLAGMLKLEIPITSLGFMKYAQIRVDDVISFKQKYSPTLEKFICYCDPTDIEDELFNLVLKSPRLKHFVYHGYVSSEMVRALVNLRGAEWEKFEVLEDNIITRTPVSLEDQDVVVGQKQNGEYYLIRQQCMLDEQTEEERHVSLINLYETVSAGLGYNWTPVDSRVFQLTYVQERNMLGDGGQNIVHVVPSKYPIASGWPWVSSS